MFELSIFIIFQVYIFSNFYYEYFFETQII